MEGGRRSSPRRRLSPSSSSSCPRVTADATPPMAPTTTRAARGASGPRAASWRRFRKSPTQEAGTLKLSQSKARKRKARMKSSYSGGSGTCGERGEGRGGAQLWEDQRPRRHGGRHGGIVLGPQRHLEGLGHHEHDLVVGEHELELGDEVEPRDVRCARAQRRERPVPGPTKRRARAVLPQQQPERQPSPRRDREDDKHRHGQGGRARRLAGHAPRLRDIEVLIRGDADAAACAQGLEFE